MDKPVNLGDTVPIRKRDVLSSIPMAIRISHPMAILALALMTFSYAALTAMADGRSRKISDILSIPTRMNSG
jgi:hypothetical protein